jgi:hypothetical protein
VLWTAGLGVAGVVLCAFGAAYEALKARFGLAAGLAVVAVALRVAIVGLGYVNGADETKLLDVAVGSIFVLVAISVRSLLRDVTTSEQGVTIPAGALALPVAACSLLQLLVPPSPVSAGGAPCDGASVAGSAYQAKTGQYGLSARLGPGATFAPARRFDASCTVGVDGYCVGEGVNDTGVPLPDVRWLRPRHTEFHVPAGTVFDLSAAADLGTAPEADCP